VQLFSETDINHIKPKHYNKYIERNSKKGGMRYVDNAYDDNVFRSIWKVIGFCIQGRLGHA
jgi:hypothetical protein